MIKKILKILPVIYVIVVIWSYIQIYNYFADYNIAINPYVSLYELLFYFIPYFLINYIKTITNLDSIYRNLVIIVLCISILLIIVIPKLKIKFKHLIRYLGNNKLLLRKFPKHKKRFFSFALVVITIFIYTTIMIISFNGNDINWIELYVKKQGPLHICFILIFFSWCILFYLIFLKLFCTLYKPKTFLYFNIICFIIFAFTFSLIKSNYHVLKVKKYGPQEIVTFQYLGVHDSTDANIDSTKNTNRIYIGILKDYLFIRDLNRKTNEIYNLNDVKYLQIKKVRYFEGCMKALKYINSFPQSLLR